MMNKTGKIIIFDFDKTLTVEDTNLGFFKFAGKDDKFFQVRLLCYYFLLVIRKFRLISNIRLKNLGLLLFLYRISETEFLEICRKYSQKIELKSSIYSALQRHFDAGDKVVVLTASLTEYVKPLFPGIEVIGSDVGFTGCRIRLSSHCYREEKIQCLRRNGINQYQVLYTDSYSDLPLAQVAEKIFLVQGNSIVNCENVEEFISLTKR